MNRWFSSQVASSCIPPPYVVFHILQLRACVHTQECMQRRHQAERHVGLHLPISTRYSVGYIRTPSI